MAKITFHPLVKQIRGKLYDDFVIKLSPQGEPIIAKRPNMSKVKWSKAQKAHRQRFKQAVENAKAALGDPILRTKYEKIAKKQGNRPWDVALSHYLNRSDLYAKK